MQASGFDEASVDGFCEVTLETRDPAALEAFYTKALCLAELWDFFRSGDGAVDGVRALAAADPS